MRSKNSRRIDRTESEHLAWVKEQPCSCCGAAGPSQAHHIVQGDHFTTIPLCPDCHTGPQGIHGDKTRWRIFKCSELSCLNHVIRWLREG